MQIKTLVSEEEFQRAVSRWESVDINYMPVYPGGQRQFNEDCQLFAAAYWQGNKAVADLEAENVRLREAADKILKVLESAALRERIAVLEAEIKAWRDADLYCDLVGYAAGDYCGEVEPDPAGEGHREAIRIAREITGELDAALRGKGGGDE